MIKKIIVIVVLIMMIGSIFLLNENKVNNVKYNPQTTTSYSFTITTSINPAINNTNFYINTTGLDTFTGTDGDLLLYVNNVNVASYSYTTSSFSILYSITTDSTIYEKATITIGRPPIINTYTGTSNTITENVILPTYYSFSIITSVNPVKSANNFYINSSGLQILSGYTGNLSLYINNIKVANYLYTTSTFSILYSLSINSSIYEIATLYGKLHKSYLFYNGSSNVINEVVIIPKYNVDFISNINGYYGLNISTLSIQKGNLTLQFADGTYSYKANATGYNNIISNFVVNGQNINVYLNFTLIKYNVEFIPNIKGYYGLNISTLSIQKGNLTLQFVNGSYLYKANATGYSNISGSFTIAGKNISIYLNFTSVIIEIQYIIFKENGYKGNWAIIINGISYSSNNNSIYIVKPNYYFNYSYFIIIPNGYNVNKSQGNVFNNSSIVYVSFNKVSIITNNSIFILVIFIITGLLVYLIYKRL